MQVKLRVIVALLALSATTLAAGPETQAVTAPNVLIVLTDDQRAEALDAMPLVSSWMQDGGTEFTSAFASTPICCPSRASIMSGKYTHNHKVHRQGAVPNFNHSHTIQRALRSAGYRTAIAGKFFNGWKASEKPPYFHHSDIGEGYRNVTFVENGDKKRTVDYGPKYVFERAKRWLASFEKGDARPWYMYLSPSAPHSPFIAQGVHKKKNFAWSGTPATAERSRSDKPGYVRRSKVTKSEGKRLRTRQLRTLLTIDKSFNDLMRTLDRLGELSNTYVVFTSDNGYLWGDHGMEGKAVPYMGSIHVPLLVRGPTVPARVVDDRIAGNIDIAPTVYDMAGVAPRYRPDGKSLLDAWSRPYLLLDSGGPVSDVGSRWRSLISNTWHYTRYSKGKKNEYYDRVADPFELTNLYKDGDASNDPSPPLAELRAAMKCAGSSCP